MSIGELKEAEGPELVALATDFVGVINKHISTQRPAGFIAQVMLALAIDLWRMNYGDDDVEEAFEELVRIRLSEPPEAWGVEERHEH